MRFVLLYQQTCTTSPSLHPNLRLTLTYTCTTSIHFTISTFNFHCPRTNTPALFLSSTPFLLLLALTPSNTTHRTQQKSQQKRPNSLSQLQQYTHPVDYPYTLRYKSTPHHSSRLIHPYLYVTFTRTNNHKDRLKKRTNKGGKQGRNQFCNSTITNTL